MPSRNKKKLENLKGDNMRHGLPSKFAKLGFKKGWIAYRAAKRGHGGPAKKSHTKTKTKNPLALFQLSGPTHHKGSTVKKSLTISKIRLQGMANKTKNALSKLREMKNGGALEVGIGLGEAAAGALGSSWLLGMVPVPAAIKRPGLVKSGAQALIGGGVAVAMYKNKHARFVGFGMGLMGVIGLARELFPIPQFAGEVDQLMFGPLEGGPLEGGPLEGGPLEGGPVGGENPMEGEGRSNEFSPAYMGGNANPWGND